MIMTVGSLTVVNVAALVLKLHDGARVADSGSRTIVHAAVLQMKLLLAAVRTAWSLPICKHLHASLACFT
jgi:hypothetical protein